MRILILCKRQYTGKDLLDDHYGRLYEIPVGLAARGYDVTCLAFSYQYRAREGIKNDGRGNLNWHSENLLPFGLWRYPRHLAGIVKEYRPDVIWACSDAFHGIIGWALSKSTGIPLVIDLYDNFESFAGSRIPGVKILFRKACRHAAALTVVSHELQQYVIKAYGVRAPVFVTWNGIRQDLFYKTDRQEARTTLSLPLHGQLIGTAGALYKNRGISDIFDAFLILAAENPNIYFVIAGPRDRSISHYRHPRIIDLGMLPLEQVPNIYAALDVAVICNRDSNFGRYCFPLKLFEIISMRIPLVAAHVGDVGKLLASTPQNLYQPGDSRGLAFRIQQHLQEPKVILGLHVQSWSDCSDIIEKSLKIAVASNVG